MFGQAHANAAVRSLQYAFTALLGLVVVFLLSVLVATITDANAKQANSAQANELAANTYSDSPLTISADLGHAANNVLRSVNGVARGVQSGMLSAAIGVVEGVANFGGGVQRSLAVAGGGVANGIAWTVQAPVKAIGSIGATPGVKKVIQPESNGSGQIPTIDPNAAFFHTSSANDPPQPTPPAAPVVVWPIRGAITTYFGVVHWPYQPTHTGLDISDGRPRGVTSVHPFRAGTVVAVIPVGVDGLGNHVVVDHGGGLSSVYGHMDSIAVKIGQQVDTNSVLGQEGTTGASTGPHVHLEIRQDGVPKNPLDYIGP